MAIKKKGELSIIKERTWSNYSPEVLKELAHDNFIECTAEYCLEQIGRAHV